MTPILSGGTWRLWGNTQLAKDEAAAIPVAGKGLGKGLQSLHGFTHCSTANGLYLAPLQSLTEQEVFVKPQTKSVVKLIVLLGSVPAGFQPCPMSYLDTAQHTSLVLLGGDLAEVS